VLPYSGRPGFSYPFVLGLLSILFSFGRGLAFYTPGLLLWLSRRTRRLAAALWPIAWLMLLFLTGLVLLYAKWWAWYAGIGWGPRFFAFAAIPSSLAIALRLTRAGKSTAADAVTLGVLILSGWVAVSGAVSNLSELGFCFADTYKLESLCWYVPEFSTLWHPVLDFPPLDTGTATVAVYIALVFAWLAAPLVESLVRAALALRPPRGWKMGWGI
jgi:hypothetical protein